jgi:enoyl-CoA hydratase/carnithine racemase
MDRMEAARMSEVWAEVRGGAGLITLNRPKALNALSLAMIRRLTALLLQWREDPAVQVVAIRGMGKEGPFSAFCAGGDIRFFHKAALEGNPELEDFFTEEYALNHLIHGYGKPYVVFMDGIAMGGGMGIAGHGGAQTLRIATERTKMAMPETNIGLFPDVGGGWFLSRCPGHIGEYLALTGHVIGAADALVAGLADKVVASGELPALWEEIGSLGLEAVALIQRRISTQVAGESALAAARARIDRFFGLGSVPEIVQALEADGSSWAAETAAALRKRSPLMLHVVLEQVRRGRGLSLADDLRMERDLVRHCFQLRLGAASETVEGIRALAVDKDHAPRWNPPRIEDVAPEMVEAFFRSPWPAYAHPLRHLA